MSRSFVRSRSRKSSALLPESLHEGLMRFLRLGGGVVVIAFALCIALALVSYSPRDPSWNAAGFGNNEEVVHNLCGVLGAYGADFLGQLFGLGGVLLPIIVAAWGWRIASDTEMQAGSGLDMIGWRCLAAVGAMLFCSIALGALGFAPPLEGAAHDGALGKIIGGKLASLLPHPWGMAIIAPLFAVVAIASLYLACALTLDEWHYIAQVLHQVAAWVTRNIHRAVRGLWRMLDRENSGIDEEDEEAEEADVESEVAVEAEREPSEPLAKKPAKAKAPLIKRPAASARQARLALRPEGDQALPPLELLQWPENAR
ncbi:MAG: DNA translocase FtsK 4TM domain-containing protein, partial [Alphaproteobacteria bacterium]